MTQFMQGKVGLIQAAKHYQPIVPNQLNPIIKYIDPPFSLIGRAPLVHKSDAWGGRFGARATVKMD